MNVEAGRLPVRRSFSPTRICTRWFCVFLLVALLLACIVPMVTNAYVPLLQHAWFAGVFWIFIFSLIVAHVVISYLFCLLADPGVPPQWLRADNVEEFVTKVVRDIAETDGGAADDDDIAEELARDVSASSAADGGHHHSDDESPGPAAVLNVKVSPSDEAMASADDDVKANTMVTSSQQQRQLYVEAVVPPEPAASDPDASDEDWETEQRNREIREAVVPVDGAEAMAQRRRRKQRRGIRSVTAPQVARKSLRALAGDGPTRTNELSFLLAQSQYCRFCMIYKLQQTHHCPTCERCVYQLDHHCVWVGQCVGYGNHKFFVLFLFFLGLGCLVSAVLSIFIVYRGYNFFFKGADANFGFYIAFTFCFSFAIVMIPYVWRHLYNVGCGESTVSSIRRENREFREVTMRRTTLSGTYQPLFEEEAAPPPRRFQFDVLRDVFGDGPLWTWFLPTMAPQRHASSVQREEKFWAEVKDIVEKQIRSIADGDAGDGEEPPREAPPVALGPDAGGRQYNTVSPPLGFLDDYDDTADPLEALNQPAISVPLSPQTGGPPAASMMAPGTAAATTTTSVGPTIRKVPPRRKKD